MFLTTISSFYLVKRKDQDAVSISVNKSIHSPSGMRFFKKEAANSLFNHISLLFVDQTVNEMACFRQNGFDLIFSSFEVQCGSF